MLVDDDEHSATANASALERAINLVAGQQKRVRKIDGDAERTEKIVNDKLNLKRTYASIKDSHSSLLLSTAVIGFTVITIVFAPLSFVTALLALNIQGFDTLRSRNDPDAPYKGGELGKIFGRCPHELFRQRNHEPYH